MNLNTMQQRSKLYLLQEGALLGTITFGFTWLIEPYLQQYVPWNNFPNGEYRFASSLYMAGIVLITGFISRSVFLHFILRENSTMTENSKKIRSLIASLPTLVKLFHAHLDQSKNTTETAALAIMERLSHLEGQTSRLLGALTDPVAHNDIVRDATLGQISDSMRQLDRMNNYLMQLEQKVIDDSRATQQVIDQVAELTPLTGIIRKVTMQTNLLALNAAVEAARAGEVGAGFAVVADEVRTLSQQINVAAERIDETIAKVTQAVNEQLGHIMAGARANEAKQGVCSLMSAMKNMSSETQVSVDAIRTSVIDVFEHTQFQDITRQQIEQVQNGLTLCGQSIEAVAQLLASNRVEPLELPNFTEVEESLRASYTMQAQHATHNAVVGGKSNEQGGNRPAIELF